MIPLSEIQQVALIKKGDKLTLNTQGLDWNNYTEFYELDGLTYATFEVIDVPKPDTGDLKAHIITLSIRLFHPELQSGVKPESVIKGSELLNGHWHWEPLRS